MLPSLEALLSDIIFGPPLDLEDAQAVRAQLGRYALSSEDRAALEGGELRRLAIYRELVRARLKEAIELQAPRSVALLGERFEAWFSSFLADRGPQTQYLRDVAGEFLDYVAPRWQHEPSIPAYLIELARHEALEFEIAALPPSRQATRAASAMGAELSLEAGLEFCEAARLVRYDYAVQRWLNDAEGLAASEPERTPTALLVYRDPEHEVRFLELTPLAASIIERLYEGLALGPALTSALSRHQTALEPEVLEQCAELLADLSERGVILGPVHREPGSTAPSQTAPSQTAPSPTAPSPTAPSQTAPSEREKDLSSREPYSQRRPPALTSDTDPNRRNQPP